MNMPEQDSRKQATTQPPAKAVSIDAVEDMLRKLMHRLDENDRRYGAALGEMNQRLNEISERAQAAGVRSSGSSAALDRVRDQASSLAAQVDEAGAARRAQHGVPIEDFEQRLGGFSGANDDAPGSTLGDARLNEDFADVTERLERSLAERAPAGDFDALSHHMEDLAQRFEASLAARTDPAALNTIESQLSALTSGFTEARQNYARIETIESHLLNLVDWAQSGGAPSNSTDERLASIEQTLRALNENAREMDARTVGTLEAMNDALHSLAANAGSSGPRGYPDSAYMEDGPATSRPGPDEYAEVSISEEPEPDHADHGPSAEEIGASIPDYQPAPGKPRASDAEKTGRTGPRERVEPTFEADNDFIASARRAAAAAAAQEPPPRQGKSSGRSRKRLAGMTAGPIISGMKRPRPVFVIALVGLLLISAGLLYARLKSKSPAPQFGASQQLPAQPPAAVPGPAKDNSAPPAAPAPKAPAPKKQHSGRLQNETATPGQAEGPVTPAAPAQEKITRTTPKTGTPAKSRSDALVNAGRPLSTATILASLPPNGGQKQMPDVTMTIKEPAARTPAPRVQTAPQTAAPALVPPAAAQSGPDPMALPKRVPAPSRAPRPSPAGTASIDSARASEVSPPGSEYQTAMPPARIGPQSLRVAAARGNPAAQAEIASRYAKGNGVPKDLKKAAEWYARAASKGFAPGQYRLAALYERGQGVKKDTGKARTWYRRAAELGNIRAMHNLAVLYTRRDGREPDYVSARNWFHEAARHGLADSQFNLGILYESGLGVTRNEAEAYKWFSLAARQGDAEALKRREALRTKLPSRSLKAVEHTLASWKQAPAKEAANRSGPPRGGWHNAKIGQGLDDGDPALVARAQYLLNKLGYDAGVPDGKLGSQTASAIRRFEVRSGSPRSGKITPALVRRLEALGS